MSLWIWSRAHVDFPLPPTLHSLSVNRSDYAGLSRRSNCLFQ